MPLQVLNNLPTHTCLDRAMQFSWRSLISFAAVLKYVEFGKRFFFGLKVGTLEELNS